MAKVFEAVGTSVRTEYAQRADGQWFKRYQDRDPRYGYYWTRWTPCAAPAKAEWIDGMPGISDGGFTYGIYGAKERNIRLPKG